MKNRLVPLILAAVAILTLSGCGLQAVGFNVNNCPVSALRSGGVAIAGVKTVRITSDSGRLDIQGQAGATEVKAGGRACAQNASGLDQIMLKVEKVGDEARVTAYVPRTLSFMGPRLELAVTLPDNLPVTVEQSSGSLTVQSVAGLNLTKGSGSAEVDGVAGDVQVRSDSGSMKVSNVTGNLTLTRDSGSTVIRDVGGNVTIPGKDSGSLSIARVGGSVLVARDGSGSLNVTDVKGDLTVQHKSSGSLHYDNIDGHVRVPSR